MNDSSPVVFPEDENDEQKRQHLRAFLDFYFDLFEEEHGDIPPEEKDLRLAKDLPLLK